MDTGVDFCAGAHGWITDGEIIFSRREAKNLVIRDGYNIRYRHGDHFEAIEFGLSNDYLFYRIKSNLILKAKSQIMFGFNRWDDMATTRHKFWDAVIVDYSLSQSVLYNPLDQRAIIVGLGLMENVYYVHSQKVKIQPALMLHLGLKL